MGKIRVLVILVLMVFILMPAGCSREPEGEAPGRLVAGAEEMRLLERVPEDVHALVKFEAIETLYQHLAVSENAVAGVSLKQADMEKMKSGLGFNPLNLHEVRRAGLDPQKPFCLAVSNIRVNPDDKKETDFDALVLLPVIDGTAATNTIRNSLKKKNIPFTETEKQGVSFLEWGLKWGGPEAGAEICAAVRDPYLYLAMNAENDSRAFLESVLEGNASVTRTGAFRKIAPDTDFTRDLVAYFNIAKLVEDHSVQIRQAAAARSATGAEADRLNEALRQYSAGTISVDLGSPDFKLNTAVSLVPDSDIKKIWRPDRVNRQKILGIQEPAALLLSLGVDILEYYRTVIGILPPERSEALKTRMEAFEQKTGIDPESDLIGNLSGSMNLALYDGASITLMNYNALFTAGIRDEQVMKNAIEKAIQLLSPDMRAMISRRQVVGKDAYVVNAGMAQLYAGVDDSTFVLASAKPMFEKALAADKSKGFAANLEDVQLKDSLMGNRNVFYLNMDEIVKIVNNFAMFLAGPAGGEQKFKEKLDAASRFEYLLATSGLEKDMVKSMLTIKTRFTRPFFVELAGMETGGGKP